MWLQIQKMCSTRIFVFVLFCISCALCKKKLCDMNDSKCLTEGAERLFKQFISGMPGVEPSDPLHLDLLEANLPTLKYKVIDGTLSGMKNCHVELLHSRISQKDKKFNYHIACPHLIYEGRCEVKGKLGPEFVEGKGCICKIDYYDYYFLFNGDYETKEACNDGKSHFHLKNHKLEVEAKGKVHHDFKNLFSGNKEKSDAAHEFANENWQFVDKLVRQPLMEAFMNKYIDNVNNYLGKVPVQDLFLQE